MAQKFIITNNGDFRFGEVGMHRELLRPGEDCLGGGFYEFDYATMRMLLSGRSYDYGRPAWHLIDCLNIPPSLSGVPILYDDIPIERLVPVKYNPQ